MYNEDLDDEDCIFTVEDFKDLAKTYLTLFFKNKKDYFGNEIDIEDLHSNRNISMVLNFDICNGMPYIYKALKLPSQPTKKTKIPEDVKFVLGLLRECSKLQIPKCFASGIIAVYIEVCKDCRIFYEGG